MENTKTPWESNGNWSMRNSPLHGPECARGLSLKRDFFSWWGGTMATRNLRWMLILQRVILPSSQHKIKRRAAGQGDPGVEGNLGRGLGRSCCRTGCPWGGKGSTCPLPMHGPVYAAALTFAVCSPARMRWSFLLVVLMILIPSDSFIVSAC